MEQRNYRMDNIRFLLILCVLIGHFLELFKGEFTSDLYKIIYSFHMPAFLFLTGYFAHFQPKKIILNLIYPYILFQIQYQLFDAFIIKKQQEVSLQFSTPYWLLWYLLVTIYCYLLLPFFDAVKPYSCVFMVCASVLLSLLAGYDTSIGYYGSLARFFSFLPFFLAGHYYSRIKRKQRDYSLWLILLLIVFLFLARYYIIENPNITRKVLYASCSYEKASYTFLIKLFLMLIGFVWISFLLFIVPNKKVPLLSALGQHTLPVFLLHGFLVKLAGKYKIFRYSESENLILALIFSVAIICIFGNPWSAKWFQRIFTGKWIDNINKSI